MAIAPVGIDAGLVDVRDVDTGDATDVDENEDIEEVEDGARKAADG